MKERLLIGVITADCHIEYQRDLLDGIISQAFKSSCDTVVIAPLTNFFSSSDNRMTEKNIFKFILSDRIDGFLYNRNSFHPDEIRTYIDELCISSGKPIMLLDHNDHKLFETTSADDSKSFEEIVDHLIEHHGYKKIYCLTGPKNIFCSQERLDGYLRSMSKHGLHCDKSYYFYGDFWTACATELADKIINGEIEKPDAIACGNDIMAVTLVERFFGRGLRVPEDIAVTGYDASMDGYQMNPSITSYRRPNFQLGSESFRRLYRIITGKICNKVPNVGGELRIGRSCGCVESHRLVHEIRRRIKVDEGFQNVLTDGDILTEMSNLKSIAEIAESIDNHTYLIYKMSRLLVCLTADYEASLSADSGEALGFDIKKNVRVILDKSAVHRYSEPNTLVTSDEFLDILRKNRRQPCAFYLSPLHCSNDFYGYCAVSFGKETATYGKPYTQWIKYLDIALNQIRSRSIMESKLKRLEYSSIHSETAGMLNLRGLKELYGKRLKTLPAEQVITYIHIGLTDMKNIYYQNGHDDTADILGSFTDILKSAVKQNEICGTLSPSCYAIIIFGESRAEEIFYFIHRRIESHVINSGTKYGAAFTLGVSSGTAESGINLDEMLHKAAVNPVHTYSHENTKANPQFEKICRLRSDIMKNPEYHWKVNEIADKMFISKSYLQKIYKQYFNRSIIEELIYFRIEKAKKLLIETNSTVTDIARDCGYSTYNYFVRQFRMIEEISPTEFREQNKF